MVKKIEFVNENHAQCFKENFECEVISFCPNSKICKEMSYIVS